MSALTDRITRMVADAMAGEDVHDELTEIKQVVESLEYRAVMSAASLTDRAMQAEYQGPTMDANGWEEIEYAPKDGRRVQLKNVSTGEFDVGYWDDCSHVPQITRDALWPEHFRNSDGTWPDGEWVQEAGNGVMTHWRPLATENADGR